MDKVKIGKIVSAVGLKGEVKVYSYSSSKERYKELDRVYAGNTEFAIESVRFVKENVILKLSGIDDRNAAEAARGKEVFIDADMLPTLPDGEYYVRDILGFSVSEGGIDELGRLSDVLQTGAHDLYEVEMPGGKKILIPAVEEFITEIDLKEKRISVKLPAGLI